MASVSTMDTEAVAEQCARGARAGAGMFRVTVRNRKEAAKLKNIKEAIRARGCDIPLVADVHFNPVLAYKAAEVVEKVRVNPGNFVADHGPPAFARDPGKASFAKKATAGTADHGLLLVIEKLSPLIEICRKNGVALRIGVNHGSLAGRMLEKYGDTPRGMVESAMEYVRIAHEQGFHRLVVSLKSSNPLVMAESNRLLVNTMQAEDLYYPVHLGVTEAGWGEEGRIRSVIGMGPLLQEGIGNTIRVSLTEDPLKEVLFCKKLLDQLEKDEGTVLLHESKHLEKVPRVIQKIYKKEEFRDLLNLEENNRPDGLIPAPGLEGEVPPSLQDRILHEPLYPGMVHFSSPSTDWEEVIIQACLKAAPLFLEKRASALLPDLPQFAPRDRCNLSFGILQACRVRMSRAEYISCPGCGRTGFDLEETTARIKAATRQLKHLKIAVMGCIVNGPGEMADADYGYVGSGRGKITLYKGKKVQKRNIPEADAVDELVDLIKNNKDWVE